MSQKRPCVYILASRRNGTLYIGATTNLASRIEAHRAGAVPGFTRKYAVRTLVYAEPHETIGQALLREKQIKKWQRKWKLGLIEKKNPYWVDLTGEIV